jgi:hypothetical protein
LNVQPATKTEIDLSTMALKVFVASFFVAMNIAGPLVWNETAFKMAFVALFKEHSALQPFRLPMLENGVYLEIFTWMRSNCVFVVAGGRHGQVKLNDNCLRFVEENHRRLSQEVIVTIRALGQEFYRRTQIGA